jgi:hypothetical protein
MSIKFMAVTIGLGNGCSAGLTEDNELMINHSNRTTMVDNQISTGVRTKKQLDNMIEYLNRLRIHLPE